MVNLLIVAVAATADLISAGSVIVPDSSVKRQSEILMFRLLDETGADRALFAEFKDGERVAIATVASGGVPPIQENNRVVSIREKHYSELYRAHTNGADGECWAFDMSKVQPDDSTLYIGMDKVGANSLASCPVHHPGSRSLWGAISVSFDQEGIDPKRVFPELRKAAEELGELDRF